MREFWLHDRRDLDEIAASVGTEFGASLAGESEARYAWFVGQSPKEGLIFNISRSRVATPRGGDNPIRISVRGPAEDDATLTKVGVRLAICLGARVTFGEVMYEGRDQFRFEQVRVFVPE